MRYRPEVDGLRAIAVLSVIIYHAEITAFGREWLKGGYIGVDIFFVISGYLISKIIFSELFETGRFNFVHFYERRARRILPMLFTVALASFPFAWIYLFPDAFIEFSESIITAIFFSSNFFFYFATTEYGTDSSLLKPFLHTWSLGIEEQFYFVFPILILLFHKYLKPFLLPLLASIFLLSLVFSQLMSTKDADLNFFLPMSRFWELLAGSMLAYLELKKGKVGNKFAVHFLPILGLGLIAFSVVTFDESTAHPGIITLIPIVGVSAIIAFSSQQNRVGKILGSRPFVAVGLISYSAYLWHFPIFAFSRIQDSTPSLVDKFLWILLTFAFSIASYFFIEQPFRNRTTITSKRLVQILSSLLVVLLGTCVLVLKNDGYAYRVSIDYSPNKELIFPRGTVFPDQDNDNPFLVILGDSFVIGDDYENEPVRFGNWTTLINHLDLKNYNVIALSYLMCDFSFENKTIELTAIRRAKNTTDCQNLVEFLNSEKVGKRVGGIILSSHRPFYRYGAKFELIDHVLRNSDLNPTVYVLGNYINLEYPEHSRCENLMRESQSSAAICITKNLKRNIRLHLRPYDDRPKFPTNLQDDIKYIDMQKVLVGDNWLSLEEKTLIDRLPHTIDGMPFLLDTHHNTSVFIDNFAKQVKKYDGEDQHILEFKTLLDQSGD